MQLFEICETVAVCGKNLKRRLLTRSYEMANPSFLTSILYPGIHDTVSKMLVVGFC